MSDSVFGNRFSPSKCEYSTTFNDFALGKMLQATASINIDNLNPEGRLELNRVVSIERLANGSKLVLTDASLSQQLINRGFGRLIDYSFNAAATVVGNYTNNVAVAVSKVSPFVGSLQNRFTDDALYTFTGQLRMFL